MRDGAEKKSEDDDDDGRESEVVLEVLADLRMHRKEKFISTPCVCPRHRTKKGGTQKSPHFTFRPHKM